MLSNWYLLSRRTSLLNITIWQDLFCYLISGCSRNCGLWVPSFWPGPKICLPVRHCHQGRNEVFPGKLLPREPQKWTSSGKTIALLICIKHARKCIVEMIFVSPWTLDWLRSELLFTTRIEVLWCHNILDGDLHIRSLISLLGDCVSSFLPTTLLQSAFQ